MRTRWLPPRSVGERFEWSRAHPSLAGFYVGFAVGMTSFVLFVGRGGSWTVGIGLGLVVWFGTGSVAVVIGQNRFGLHRFGERPDAEQQSMPTYRRMWSRASDRFLFWMMMIGIAGTVASVIGLVGSGRSVSDVITLLCGLWLGSSTALERRTRPSEASSRRSEITRG
jgi:hypothetical protein